jgi:hypothetical protein
MIDAVGIGGHRTWRSQPAPRIARTFGQESIF